MKKVAFLRPVFSLSIFVIFLLCPTLLATHTSLAQNASEGFGEIQGKVSDALTGEPIPFASVSYLLPTGEISGTQTDFDGYYSLKPLPKGKYKLTFSFVGYETQTVKKVVVKANEITQVDVQLKQAKTLLDHVAVSSLHVSTQSAKVKRRDKSGIDTKGSRRDNSSAYIDGIRVRGISSLPANAMPPPPPPLPPYPMPPKAQPNPAPTSRKVPGGTWKKSTDNRNNLQDDSQNNGIWYFEPDNDTNAHLGYAAAPTSSGTVQAQVFSAQEITPEFPGGNNALSEYIAKNTSIPTELKQSTMEGRVFVQFIVNEDGTLSDYQVVRGINNSLNDEALRVVKGMPKWKPGKDITGKVQKTRFVVPIHFPPKEQASTTEPNRSNETITPMFPSSVELAPEFVGGQAQLMQYMAKNLRYPEWDKETATQGTVVIHFDVNEDGSIGNAVVRNKVSAGLEQEAIRLVKNMPNWLPGISDNKSVKKTVTLPLKFCFDDRSNGTIIAEPQNLDGEHYNPIVENEFLQSKPNPLSTFSIDVDKASYSNVRRIVQQDQQVPPADAVRTEEMINYFVYDYPAPDKTRPFSITTEMQACPWNPKHQLALIGLQGKKVETKNAAPGRLVFLIDVSGSMSNALPLLKESLKLLTQQMRSQDQVAIVVYAGAAGLVLPPTSGADKKTIEEAIDRLQSGGSTAGGAGILLAYETAKKNFDPKANNRVILCTDGDFNVGVSSQDELIKLIEEQRKTGVFLSVLGFGSGNYQDGKMEQLANKGNGNYAYIDNIKEAKRTLVEQMTGTIQTIAKDVKIQVEFNPANVRGYRLIGYENRLLNAQDFNDDTKDAGEIGAGHTVTALYEVVLNSQPNTELVTTAKDTTLKNADPLKYQDKEPEELRKVMGEIMTVKFRYKAPNDDKSTLIEKPLGRADLLKPASNNFTWASTLAEFSLLLRNSNYKGQATMEHILQRAQQAKASDKDGSRAEFIELAKECQKLMNKTTDKK